MGIILQVLRNLYKIRELNYKDLIIFLIPFIIFSFYLYVFDPGILTYDSFNQLHQIATSNYANWHPFFHTFIEMLCIKIYPSPISVAVLQILTFSTMWMIICRYNRQDKSKNMDRQFAIQAIFTLFISLIPVNAIYAITLWKDILFSYNLMFLCFLFKVLIDKKGHVSLKFAIVISLLMSFIAQLRPNGIYIIILILIVLFIYLYFKNKSEKLYIIIPALTIVFILLIASLNVAFDVEDNQKDALMAKTAHQLADYDLNLNISDSDRDKIHQLISEDRIQNNFYLTSSDLIMALSNEEVFHNNTFMYISMVISYSLKNPIHFLEYFFGSSPLVWNIGWESDCIGLQFTTEILGPKGAFFHQIPPSESYENVTPKNLGTSLYDALNSFLYAFLYMPLNTLITPALYMYLSILCMIAIRLITKSRSIYFIYIPTLINIMVVMVSIPAQDTRYLYANFLTFYLLVIILINEWEKNKLKKNTDKLNDSSKENYIPDKTQQDLGKKNADESKQDPNKKILFGMTVAQITNLEEQIVNKLDKYYPFIIVFILIFFIHLFMGKFSDDVIFSERLINRTLPELIVWRYNSLTARVIIDSVISIVTKEDMIFWRLLDSIIYTFGIYYAIKFVNNEKNRLITVVGILLFMMYPFCDMCSAGWMATTITYLWTFSCAIISLVPIVNSYRNEKTPAYMYIVSALCLIFAANQEQVCALIFGLNVIFLLDSIINKKKINKFNILAIIVTIISFINIIYCPGTALRYAWELPLRYPEYAGFGIIEKLYLGIVPTVHILINNKLIIAAFFTLLNICVGLKTENKNLKTLTYVNIGLIFCLTFLSSIIIMVFPGMNNVFVTFGLKSLPNLLSREAIIALLISLYLIASSIILLYHAFDKKLFYPLLFLGGFLTRLMIGFSPTIFFSGSRTALYFYMILIILTLMLIKMMYDENRISKKQEYILITLLGIVAILNYIYVILGIL